MWKQQRKRRNHRNTYLAPACKRIFNGGNEMLFFNTSYEGVLIRVMINVFSEWLKKLSGCPTSPSHNLLAYIKTSAVQMPKKCSNAQKLQIKNLAASLTPPVVLSDSPSLPVKTWRQVQQKEQADRIHQQQSNIDDLSSKLDDAETQIAAKNLETCQKDALILEMQLKIQIYKDNTLTFEVCSLEFATLLESNTQALRKARNRTNRITNEHRLTKSRLNARIKQLTVDFICVST